MPRASTYIYPKEKPGFHLGRQQKCSHLFTAVNVGLHSIPATAAIVRIHLL